MGAGINTAVPYNVLMAILKSTLKAGLKNRYNYISDFLNIGLTPTLNHMIGL